MASGGGGKRVHLSWIWVETRLFKESAERGGEEGIEESSWLMLANWTIGAIYRNEVIIVHYFLIC